MKAFFEWLISQQDEDNRHDYETATEVAIDQKWEVCNLRQMTTPGGDLYIVAVLTFKLKDSVVRHFAREIRRYKAVAREKAAIAALVTMGGDRQDIR